MSHIPERKEKDCLNCGTIVQGHYCQHCGQENVVPKETFWHMVTHFFYDITHFDSNFFSSIRHLVLRPGFLSEEYMRGRRASYLHPIKMYVFSSAIFFLLFFSFFKPSNAVDQVGSIPLTQEQRAEEIRELQADLLKDSSRKDLKLQLALLQDTSKVVTMQELLKLKANGGFTISFSDKEYHSFEEYDSAQQLLPSSERDGWLLRKIVKKGISINNRYKGNDEEALKKLLESFFHRLPYMLFVSLPLFALILKLVYIRRKQFFFADHGVFTIHLYVFSFITLLLVFSLAKLEEKTGWDFLGWVIFGIFVALNIYLYKAMRRFYKQGRGKTFSKYLIVAILSLLMMVLLFVIFLVFSAATI